MNISAGIWNVELLTVQFGLVLCVIYPFNPLWSSINQFSCLWSFRDFLFNSFIMFVIDPSTKLLFFTIKHVARFCTFLSSSTRYWQLWSHTVPAYSGIGLTQLKNAVSFTFLLQKCRFLLSILRTVFALSVTPCHIMTCFFSRRSEEIFFDSENYTPPPRIKPIDHAVRSQRQPSWLKN